MDNTMENNNQIQHQAEQKSSSRSKSNMVVLWRQKPSLVVDALSKRRIKRHKRELRQQRSIPLREITTATGYQIIGKRRSTSRHEIKTLQPPKIQKNQPSVTKHFAKKRPTGSLRRQMERIIIAIAINAARVSRLLVLF